MRHVVPLGVEKWLAERDIADVVELNLWASTSLGSMRVHAVAAQHLFGRGPLTRNRTFWMGWVMEIPSGNVSFARDTGYALFFREIGERSSPIRLSLIPIGAYRPHWFMGPVHAIPQRQ